MPCLVQTCSSSGVLLVLFICCGLAEREIRFFADFCAFWCTPAHAMEQKVEEQKPATGTGKEAQPLAETATFDSSGVKFVRRIVKPPLLLCCAIVIPRYAVVHTLPGRLQRPCLARRSVRIASSFQI